MGPSEDCPVYMQRSSTQDFLAEDLFHGFREADGVTPTYAYEGFDQSSHCPGALGIVQDKIAVVSNVTPNECQDGTKAQSLA